MTGRDAIAAAADAARAVDLTHGYGARAPYAVRAADLAPTRLRFKRSAWPTITADARRVAAVLRGATADDTAAGLTWYGDARAIAADVAARHGLTVRVTAAALAAVSPGMPWDRNGEALHTIARSIATDTPLRDAVRAARLPVPYGYGPYRTAAAILADADGDMLLTGRKRRAFAAGVVTAGRTAHVCVDGHAYLTATVGATDGVRPGITAATVPSDLAYDRVAASFAIAARDVYGDAVRPAQAQAIAWLAWRRLPTDGGAA